MDALIHHRRDQIKTIAARHGAYNVRVFGSMATGTASSESDVDLLVDVREERSFFFPGGLVADLEEALGRPVQVVTEDALHAYIREEIIQTAQPL